MQNLNCCVNSFSFADPYSKQSTTVLQISSTQLFRSWCHFLGQDDVLKQLNLISYLGKHSQIHLDQTFPKLNNFLSSLQNYIEYFQQYINPKVECKFKHDIQFKINVLLIYCQCTILQVGLISKH